jgi:outer membrane immunogenic protein
MKARLLGALAALFAIQATAFAQVQVITGGASNSASASSWVAGAQVGFNWQSGPWVYGVEEDISGMHLNSGMNTLVPAVPPSNANANADVDWYGTFRGRLGWTSGPLLLYGTGGVAYGHVDLNGSIFSPLGPRNVSLSTSATKTGWVAGGGIEYEWSPNVILNLGYQYVDLGSISVSGTNTAFTSILSENVSAHARFSVVSAGLSWRFYTSTIPSAWGGLYAGGHVGGAWGKDLNANYFDFPPVPSDARLKRDITLVARLDEGLGLYRYRYLWSDTVYVGVMAQEVALLHPDAIVRDALDGYLRVDYGRLGLRLMTLQEWEANSRGEAL